MFLLKKGKSSVFTFYIMYEIINKFKSFNDFFNFKLCFVLWGKS